MHARHTTVPAAVLLAVLVLLLTTAAAEETAVSTEGGIEVSRYDGSAWFEFGGRVAIDGAFYAEDEVALGDGTELRRASFEAEGGVAPEWEFEFGCDFADGTADVKDAALCYTGLAATRIVIGQQKTPFSIEELTSAKNITFLERALVNELVPRRRIGVAASHQADTWTASLGVFGEAFDDDADDEGNEGWSTVGRATFAPIRDDDLAVHFGAHASMENPDSEREVKFNARPESHVTDIKYLDTGKIKRVEEILTWGAEGAAVFGPFSVQGEYISCSVTQAPEEEERTFSGWYAYASWFVTGESRDYDKDGTFGSVKPLGRLGALELAARYSTLNLSDGEIEGGEETNITVALNWYPNSHVRFMMNYVIVDNDDCADADGDVDGDDDPGIFQLRCQVAF
jgi:phosphate-selective porin OprO/OprP